MTIFEYFFVLISVVLSLALAQLVTGVGELIRARGQVRWAFGHAVWLLIAFLLVIDLWASLWLVRTATSWKLVTLIFVIVQASTIYLFTLWLCPRAIGEGPIDLRDYQLAERRLYLGALIGYCVGGAITNITVLPPGARMDWANYLILAPALLIAGTAWWSPNRWVQTLAPVAMVALMVAYFAVYFPTIG